MIDLCLGGILFRRMKMGKWKIQWHSVKLNISRFSNDHWIQIPFEMKFNFRFIAAFHIGVDFESMALLFMMALIFVYKSISIDLFRIIFSILPPVIVHSYYSQILNQFPSKSNKLYCDCLVKGWYKYKWIVAFGCFERTKRSIELKSEKN